MKSDPATASTPQQQPNSLAGMHPAYFAMAMATGIVSIACHLFSMRVLAVGLFAMNIVFYVMLWLLLALRIARYRDRVIADLLHHGRSVGFFTIVAATCVLGSQFWLIASAWRVAAGFWVFGILLWAGLTYTIFTIITVKSVKPALAEGINGGWLVAVVAAQSVCVLGAQLSAGFSIYRPH